MSNYYDDLINKIEELIKKDKKHEALNIIKEELNLPYVPKLYEDKLNNYLAQLDEKKEKKPFMFSREELITIMNESKKHDVNFLLDVSSGFEQYNWNGFEKEIEVILNDKNLDNKVKSIIYNNLVVQGLSYDFKIGKYVINPTKNKTMFETHFALKNLVDLSHKQFDDPSIFDICEKIFFIYVMNCFPESMFFEYKNITNELISIANVMIGTKDVKTLTKEEQELYKIINANH